MKNCCGDRPQPLENHEAAASKWLLKQNFCLSACGTEKKLNKQQNQHCHNKQTKKALGPFSISSKKGIFIQFLWIVISTNFLDTSLTSKTYLQFIYLSFYFFDNNTTSVPKNNAYQQKKTQPPAAFKKGQKKKLGNSSASTLLHFCSQGNFREIVTFSVWIGWPFRAIDCPLITLNSSLQNSLRPSNKQVLTTYSKVERTLARPLRPRLLQ